MATDRKTNFVVGTLLGGAVGTIAALLLAPKSGCDLRQDIADTYDDVTDNVTRRLPNFRKKEESSNTGLMLGGIAGGALGIAAALLFTPIAGRRIRKRIINKAQDIGEQAWDLVDSGKEAINELTGNLKNNTRKRRR